MLLLKSFYHSVTGPSVNFKNRFASYNIELAVKQNAVNEIMAMVRFIHYANGKFNYHVSQSLCSEDQ